MKKYKKGAPITSFDELVKQEFIYDHDKILHQGWFLSWQTRWTKNRIESGCLFYAEKIGGDDNG